MSLRTRLRIAIVALAAIVVVGLSALYLWDFTRQAFEGANARARIIAEEVRYYVTQRVNEAVTERNLHAATSDEFRGIANGIIRTDPLIAKKLGDSLKHETVLNIKIEAEGNALIVANPVAAGTAEGPTYDFNDLSHRNAFLNLFDLFFRRQDYAVSVPISVVSDAQQGQGNGGQDQSSGEQQ